MLKARLPVVASRDRRTISLRDNAFVSRSWLAIIGLLPGMQALSCSGSGIQKDRMHEI